MLDLTASPADTRALLDALADAYAAGDAPFAELLFVQALEEDLPWDEICAAAARGVARWFGETDRA